jgi:hypothetical protein
LNTTHVFWPTTTMTNFFVVTITTSSLVYIGNCCSFPCVILVPIPTTPPSRFHRLP